MGFFDDLGSKLQKQAESVAMDVSSYIAQQVTEPLVKIGVKPAGNLSEAELRAGARGATPQLPPSQQPPAEIARAAGEQAIATAVKFSPLMIAGAAVVAYLVLSRR